MMKAMRVSDGAPTRLFRSDPAARREDHVNFNPADDTLTKPQNLAEMTGLALAIW
jgi:hypothetical protein